MQQNAEKQNSIQNPPQKDPRGLVKNDVAHLRAVFKQKRYSPKDSLSEVMHQEGIQKVIDYIEDKMIAKRG